MEPQDVATLAGGSLTVHCQAQGFPQPQITWMRGQGKITKYKYCLLYISIWHAQNQQNLIATDKHNALFFTQVH